MKKKKEKKHRFPHRKEVKKSVDKKEEKQYKSQLEYFRKMQEEEEYQYQKLKENNPKYVQEYSETLEISGYHIVHSKFEKPLIRGFERSEESIQLALEKRQKSMEKRDELQSELDAFAECYPYITKDDKDAIAELEAIKNKYKDDLTIREDNQRRKITNLKKKIQANFDEWTHFITLSIHKNMLDIKKTKEYIKKWTKDMKKVIPDFKYVYVIEFQQRGSIHFHVICRCVDENGTWMDRKAFNKVTKLWKHGNTDIKGISQKYIPKKAREKAQQELNIDSDEEKVIAIWSLGSYLTSYLEKGADNMLLFGSKMYGNSEGLKPSIKITDAKKIARLMGYLGTDGLKKKVYDIEIPETNNKITKTFHNKLITNQTKE